LEIAHAAVREMGEELAHYGLPDELIPMTFVFTSSGNVSQGAQEIFKLLPHKMVTPDEMVDLVQHKESK
jgi:alpha-aminoadipic semialdehyde synthase